MAHLHTRQVVGIGSLADSATVGSAPPVGQQSLGTGQLVLRRTHESRSPGFGTRRLTASRSSATSRRPIAPRFVTCPAPWRHERTRPRPSPPALSSPAAVTGTGTSWPTTSGAPSPTRVCGDQGRQHQPPHGNGDGAGCQRICQWAGRGRDVDYRRRHLGSPLGPDPDLAGGRRDMVRPRGRRHDLAVRGHLGHAAAYPTTPSQSGRRPACSSHTPDAAMTNAVGSPITAIFTTPSVRQF